MVQGQLHQVYSYWT